MAAPKKKSPIGGVLAAVGAGVAAYLLFFREAKADPKAPIDEPLDPVEPTDPVPGGPPVQPEEPAVPAPPVPGAAPEFDFDQKQNEPLIAFAVVDEFRKGVLPVSKPVRAKLTDVAFKRTYAGAPTKIPKGWDSGGSDILGWQLWVDTWNRLYNHVGEFLAETE